MSSLLAHLRLHFQLLLAPVYLWGWLLAGGGLGRGAILGFVSFHGFLYSGATAFNSYYDRDTGPVGGLEHPPPVTRALLPFSLAVKAVGFVIACLVNPPFAASYGIFVALSVAYSHPRIRLKRRPLGSMLVVGAGQGALAFLAAWAAARGEMRSAASPDGLIGAATATLFIVALYPISQLYQTGEDAARGDRTLAVVWGPARCFAFAVASTLLAGMCMALLLSRRFSFLDGLIVAVGVAAQVGTLIVWSHRFDARRVTANYRAVMRFNGASAGALGAYVLARLMLVG